MFTPYAYAIRCCCALEENFENVQKKFDKITLNNYIALNDRKCSYMCFKV